MEGRYVALAVLAEAATAAPLVCVIDDVQWLDPESAVVLGFVARRLYAEQVVLVLAVREPAGKLAGLPELAIAGLDEGAALELLASLVPGPLSPAVGARIVAGTGGIRWRWWRWPGSCRRPSWRGPEVLPEPLPAGGSLDKAFGRRVSRLVPEARLLLAVAAAEPTGSQTRLRRAAQQLGLDPDAAASADLGDLAAIGSRVEFRHPLICSAIYYATPLRQRRLIHRALAAAAGPDEAVAARLEQAAGTAAGTPLRRRCCLARRNCRPGRPPRPAAARRGRSGAHRGQGNWDQYCLGVLELGLGNYQATLQCALGVYDDDAPFFGTLALPDLVEAAARCGSPG